MKNKFDNKESLLDFLKSSWENGKIMDANNFSSTWDALVKNLKFEDGYRPEVTITDGEDGTHTLTITKPDGTTTSTVIKDGKNGADGKSGAKGDAGAPGFSPEVTIVDGTDGTHTLTISKPDGGTTSTVIKDGKNGANGAPGKDGFSPEVTIVDGTDGTHTLTISKPDGGTTSTVIKDGKNGANGENGADGKQGAPGKDGFSPKVTIVDGTDGTHTLTISKSDGTTTSAVIKDGKNGAAGKQGTPGEQGTPGKDGFSPEVTIVDGTDGTHTLTISKPDGGTTSTVIKDGKDGTPGISYAHPLDKNSMAVMSYSHTYYPLYQTDSFDASSPFYKFTPDIKVEVNSVAVDAPKSSIGTELSDAGWTKGVAPTSYVITMSSNYIPAIPADDSGGGNFNFSGGLKGNWAGTDTLDVPIDSLKLPTADGTSKSIADIGFISASQSFDKQPLFFMTYPRPFLIPVSIVEKNSNGYANSITNDKAIACIKPAISRMYSVPVISHEVYQGMIAASRIYGTHPISYEAYQGMFDKFSPSRKSISELPNVFKYSWTAGTVHISFDVELLTWNETTGDIDRRYTIQSDGCERVEAYPMLEALPTDVEVPSLYNTLVKSIVLNSAGREVMKLFIGDPNQLGLLNL